MAGVRLCAFIRFAAHHADCEAGWVVLIIFAHAPPARIVQVIDDPGAQHAHAILILGLCASNDHDP